MKQVAIKYLALIFLMQISAGTVLAGDERTRLECSADTSDGVASMKARFESREEKQGRTRFKAGFETAPGFGLQEGNVLQVNVGGAIVGLLTLSVKDNGDLGAEMGFDTNVDTDEPDTSVPFPANWPGTSPGTVIMIGTLGCSLQS